MGHPVMGKPGHRTPGRALPVPVSHSQMLSHSGLGHGAHCRRGVCVVCVIASFMSEAGLA